MNHTYFENFIYKDRFTSRNPHSLILGESGSGMNFITKADIQYTLNETNKNVIIIDPAGEFEEFVSDIYKRE